MRRWVLASEFFALVGGVVPTHVARAAVRSYDVACPAGQVPSAGFVDVESTHRDRRAIDCAVWWNILNGTSPTRFTPAQIASRGQLASVLVRLIATARPLPAAEGDVFADDNGSAHEQSINRLATAGIVTGTSRTSFGATQPVTRGQFATAVLAAVEFARAQVLPEGRDAFVDDETSVHEPSINALAAAGVVIGVTATRFAPSDGVSRSEAAAVLMRAVDLLAAEGRARRPGAVLHNEEAVAEGFGKPWPGPIRFRFTTDTADLANERDIIRQAIAAWQELSVPFQEVAASDPADLTIAFVTGCHSDEHCFDGPGGTVAHATLGAIDDAFVHFDDDERWAQGPVAATAEEIDLYDVALHEIGHAIGLPHSSDPTAVMASGYGGSGANGPQEDDIAAARRLYPE